MKRITLLFALLFALCANAQWTTDTAVNTLTMTSVVEDQQSFGTNDGRTFIAFWKQVNAPVNFELRVQLLDAAGNKMFGEDGMLVSNTIPMSSYTFMWKATMDKYNNLYIGVTGTGSGNEGHIYKVTPTGEMPWGAEGINLGAYAMLPTPLVLNNSDIIVSYWPGAGKAKMMRYTSAGVPVWAAPVDVNPSAAYSTKATIVADMYPMTNGDFTAVFHTKLSNGVNSLLFAQRYSADGIALWAAPTQMADKGTFYNIFYTGTQDGDVIYYGYSLAGNSRFDGFAQRINPDGTTPWGINGIDFDTNQTYYEMDTKIAFQTGSQYIWTISRYTPSSQDWQGEYVQKFDKVTGARQFTDNAHQVYAINNTTYQCHSGDLFLVNDKPVFLTTTGIMNGASPITLGATFLDVNGDPIQSAMTPVGTYAGPKGRITLCAPYNNQAVAVFNEYKADAVSKVYAQNFSLPVTCTMNPAELTDVTTPCSMTYANLTVPTINDSCGNAVVPTTDASVFPITTLGTTAITWTYTLNGTVVTRNQNIIIVDTDAPVANVTNLPNIAVQCGEVTAAMAVAPTATDGCAGTNTITATTNAVFPITALGTTVITWTYTDGSGNTTTQTQNVVIADTTAPVLTLQNATVAITEGGTAVVTAVQFDNGSTDACSTIATWTISPESFTCESIGEQTVTITATDTNGNIATGTATLTVEDPNNYCTAGINDLEKNAFLVYPNPTNDVLYIRPTTNTVIMAVRVYSLIGQEVYNASYNNGTAETNISLHSLATGTYLVNIQTSKGSITKRVVKTN